MKALKFIGIAVLALIVIFFILSFVVANEYHVEKSVEIEAPQNLVYEQAVHFDNFQTWSPWSALDSSMTTVYEGEFGKVGSKYSWEGNDDVGSGTQEITAATPEKVEIDLHFMTPFEAKAKTQYLFEPADKKVKVTWAMDGESAWPMNVMNLFMKGAIGKDYQKGLDSLKVRCEKLVSERVVDGFLIQHVELGERSYVGKRGVVKFAEVDSFYETHFGLIFGALGAKGVEPIGMPSGVFYKWDEETGTADMMAAAPCPAGTTLEGYESINVGGKALMVDYYGPYEASEKAHMAISTYMEKNKIELNVHVIEEYITDPETEKDPAKWLTKVYYMIK
ncbi:MAG: SRPBCC family protein [Saprospiraceae bacterium]|nr:SRPBCC family protein [Saprospiraceae bacterium]